MSNNRTPTQSRENIINNFTDPIKVSKMHLSENEKQIHLKTQKQKSKFEARCEMEARLEARSAYLAQLSEMESEYQQKLNEYSLRSDSIISDYVSSLFSTTSPNTEIEKKMRELHNHISRLNDLTNNTQETLNNTQDQISQILENISKQEVKAQELQQKRQYLEQENDLLTKETIDLEMELLSTQEMNKYMEMFQKRPDSKPEILRKSSVSSPFIHMVTQEKTEQPKINQSYSIQLHQIEKNQPDKTEQKTNKPTPSSVIKQNSNQEVKNSNQEVNNSNQEVNNSNQDVNNSNQEVNNSNQEVKLAKQNVSTVPLMEDGPANQLPQELFREPYRVKIPFRALNKN